MKSIFKPAAPDESPAPDAHAGRTFVGDVVKIMSGTAFAQVLGIAALPLLTRMFAPEAFGMLGVFGAITGMLGVAVCLRYELAIVLPTRENDAVDLFWTSLLIALLFTGLTALAVFFLGASLLNAVDAQVLEPYLWLLPAGVLIHGIHISLSHWNTRKRKFGRLAVAQVNNALVTTGTKVGTGVAGLTSGASLIIATLLGLLSSSLALGAQIWRDDFHTLKRFPRSADVRRLLWEYRGTAVFNSSTSVFQAISQNLPLLLLGAFFGPLTVGYYLIGNKILKMPFNLLGKSVKKVFFQRAAELKNAGGNLAGLALETTHPLFVLSIGVITLAVVGSPIAAEVVLGSDWVQAGYFMQWIAIWTCSSFITIPAASLSIVLRQDHINLLFLIGLLAVRIGSLVVCAIYFPDPLVAIMALCLSGMVFQFLYLKWLFGLVGVRLKELFSRVGKDILLSLATILLYVTARFLNFSDIFTVILLLVYSGVYVIFSMPFLRAFLKILKGRSAGKVIA